MKLFCYILLNLLLVSSGIIFCEPIKALIVEIDDILFAPDESQGLIGSLVDVNYYRQRFFDMISTIKDYDSKVPAHVLYRGQPVPRAWSYYFLDEIDQKTIYNKVVEAITNNISSWYFVERSALLHAAKIAFDIEAQANLMLPVKPMQKIIKRCKRHLATNNINAKVILFSNKNLKIVQALIEKYPRFFNIFGQNTSININNREQVIIKPDIVVSGYTKFLKPDVNAYKDLLQRYSLLPQECLVIESQQQYLSVANSLGIKGILLTERNIKDVKKVLKNINFLPSNQNK